MLNRMKVSIICKSGVTYLAPLINVVAEIDINRNFLVLGRRWGEGHGRSTRIASVEAAADDGIFLLEDVRDRGVFVEILNLSFAATSTTRFIRLLLLHMHPYHLKSICEWGVLEEFEIVVEDLRNYWSFLKVFRIQFDFFIFFNLFLNERFQFAYQNCSRCGDIFYQFMNGRWNIYLWWFLLLCREIGICTVIFLNKRRLPSKIAFESPFLKNGSQFSISYKLLHCWRIAFLL